MPFDPPTLAAHLRAQRPRLIQRIRELVETESPSEDPAAVNRAGDLVCGWAGEMGAELTRHPQERHGDVIELRFAATLSDAEAARKPLLLLGHLDTVWPVGTLATMPWREAPDDGNRRRLWGPGVLDMKAGIVMALEALAALQERGALCRPAVLLLNPDEEIGSPVSRPHTERLARLAEAVFVLEPAQGLPQTAENAAYKTSRKGVGEYRIRVRGVAAHSGVDFLRGHSAILELSRLLLKINGLNDLSTGLNVNPGVVRGGTRPNVIAAEASAELDVRIATASDGVRIHAQLSALSCEDEGCTLTITGGINRPPMERSPGTIRLFEQARALAKQLGPGMSFDLAEASTGGGSDGNFTAALGTPTLDGMGAVGEGAHAAHESILLDPLLPRTALLGAMMASVSLGLGRGSG